MACSPESLLDLAQMQLAQQTESAYRSAAHLAYYALFHAALDFAREYLGEELPGRHELHGRLSYFLRQRKNGQQRGLGNALRYAFNLRVQADYLLQSEFSEEYAVLQCANCSNQLEVLRGMRNKMEQK